MCKMMSCCVVKHVTWILNSFRFSTCVDCRHSRVPLYYDMLIVLSMIMFYEYFVKKIVSRGEELRELGYEGQT